MTKKQIYLSIIFGVVFSVALSDFLQNFKEKPEPEIDGYGYLYKKKDSLKKKNDQFALHEQKGKSNIEKLTDDELVIQYVKANHELPEYYITKSEAKRKGWVASKGNLCEVLPNRAIGGDRFSNREGKLPRGEQYYEADVNYKCGKRNAQRIVFTKDGEVWLTKDHYKTFEKQ